ncbi:MAG TPA: hypothetical protein VL326_02560 [Kofleriaceae bacterium]|nr:hypothetical protein [Kofleriaceae bacterium]
MGRTRLFHTVVVVGAGLLAGCGNSSSKPTSPAGGGTSARSADAGVADAAATDAPQIKPPPPSPRIHTVTPAKLNRSPNKPIIVAP